MCPPMPLSALVLSSMPGRALSRSRLRCWPRRNLSAAFGVLLALITCVAGASTFQPGLIWLTYLGGAGSEDIRRVACDSQGNVWLAGSTADAASWERSSAMVVQIGPGGGGDAFVTRLTSQGQLTLLVVIGGRSDDVALALAPVEDGGVVIAGRTDSDDFPTTGGAVQRQLHGTMDAFVARLANNGELTWSTLLGGASWDVSSGAAVLLDGSVAVGGSTLSADFPQVNPVQGVGGAMGWDAFVTVLSPDGDSIAFSTHLGGSGSDAVEDVAADSMGNIIVVGPTDSANFPVVRAYQSSLGGGYDCGGDAFIAKFSWPSPQIVFSTYLGGSGGDDANAVDVDPIGQITVAGGTASRDFPSTPGSYVAPPALGNLFATRFAADGSSLVFSSRLPVFASVVSPDCLRPPARFRARSDTSGHSWTVGFTYLSTFPLVNPLQSNLHGPSDGIIAVFSSDGSQLLFSTYLGGSASDALRDLAIAADGSVFVAGYTESADLQALEGSYRGAGDIFVVRINPTTTPLAASAAGSPLSGLAPLNVSFSGAATGGTGIYTFDWDFEDGSPHSVQQSPTHTYNLGGNYTATLRVTDSAAAIASASVAISVAHNCSLACTASAPAVAVAGEAASFSASSTPSDCAGSLAYQWSFGDGTTSTEMRPSHTYAASRLYGWSVQASIGSVSCVRSGTITVAAAPVAASYVLPAVVHNLGYLGTQWRSEVAVVNLFSSPATAHLSLVFQDRNGPALFATADVPAGGSREWRDILVSLFGQPDSADVSGALLVYADRPVAITVRTYDRTDSGTLGSSYPSLVMDDGVTVGQTGVVPGLKRNAGFRSNIGAVNVGSVACSVVVTLYDGSGGQLGAPRAMDLAPGEWRQLNDVLASVGTIDLAYATVKVLTASGRAWAYGSVVDNATGDPTTIPAVVL